MFLPQAGHGLINLCCGLGNERYQHSSFILLFYYLEQVMSTTQYKSKIKASPVSDQNYLGPDRFGNVVSLPVEPVIETIKELENKKLETVKQVRCPKNSLISRTTTIPTKND
jgi:hypothetical protein